MKNLNCKYLIIGNSVAGINAIESIREYDKKNSIILVGRENYHIYSRPLISYFLAGTIKENKIFYRDKKFYENNKVIPLLGKEAINLNIKEKAVALNDGQKINFESLLIATGGTPIIPKIKGLDLKGVFNFTTLDDAKNIKEYIENNNVKDAIVIGAGLIGLKATEALLANKINTTIVELSDRILSATFDKTASGIIESALNRTPEGSGCKLIMNNTVSEIIYKNSRVSAIKLKDKKTIKCNLVIVAIGVIPDISLVKDTEIKTGKGIIVDTFMQTNVPGIFAAGDVVEALDSINNVNRTIAIWPHASRQGKKAGRNMVASVLKDESIKKEYTGGFPMNSVELCNIPTISVGLTDPKEDGYEILKTYDKKNLRYKKIVLKDNVIVGAIFVGNINDAGIYTGLIRDKVNVSTFKEHLIKEDFGLLNLPKEYRKHLVTGAGLEV